MLPYLCAGSQALSDECDEVVAKMIEREVSDEIIAPSYSRAGP